MNTAFLLFAEYNTATPALATVSPKLGLSPREAVRQHALGKLPINAFRLNNSQKCPLVVRIEDLAALIDKSANDARERMVA